MTDILKTEKAYWAKDISHLLKISDSTLRKYCKILEENGYFFNRGDNNKRAFLERDFTAIKKLKDLTQNNNITLNDAAIAVVSMTKKDDDSTTFSILQKNSLLETYVDRFNKYENKLDQVLEQNELLKKELNLIHTQIASTNEKMNFFITETRSEKYKKRWWRFW